MNVLRVIWSMNPRSGGPCQGIRNSIPALEKLGVQNEVVCLDAPESDFLGTDPFVIHAVGQAHGPWGYHKALLPWLLINFSRFDTVIVHGLWQYPGYAVWKALKKFKANNAGSTYPSVFVMPHGMLDPWFQRAAGRKLKAIRNILYWKLIEAKVVNDADGLLFTCEQELRLAREPFRPYSPKKELNVGYGILPPPTYQSYMVEEFRSVANLKNKSYLLFLSRVDVKKGVDILVKAYLALKRKNYELPTLVIAGPGIDTPYGAKIREMAGDDESIYFPGMLSGTTKWGAFYGCEAFVLPSHQENFGIAVVEALACSKPVLISNQVNIWREIQEGQGGIIEEDNFEGAKEMLLRWIAISDGERPEMSKNARKIYESHFTVEKAALKLKKIISSA